MTTSGILIDMYKLQNKTTGAEVFALRFTENCVLDRSGWSNNLVSIWEDFLSGTRYSVEDANWNLHLKLYESVKVIHGDWVIRSNEGFYFPISEKLLTTLYTFVGTKPDGL
jgi:hypothetical protein